jgi:hypothetical protein
MQTISITERARRYVAKMPEAISGQHGHSTMFSVACVLTQGFDLNMGDARMLLEEYNATLTEPFSQKELEHKLQGAAKKESTKGQGYLLNPSDKPIRVRITPKKPANTPPRIIYQRVWGTGGTGVSSLITKIKHKCNNKKEAREYKRGVPPVPRGQKVVDLVLPTLSPTGVLRIPFNAPIRYRYWLRDSRSDEEILSLKEITARLETQNLGRDQNPCVILGGTG